jgi:hypothetical protein
MQYSTVLFLFDFCYPLLRSCQEDTAVEEPAANTRPRWDAQGIRDQLAAAGRSTTYPESDLDDGDSQDETALDVED